MMIINVEQGTEEWRMVRAGIPTASSFEKILTSTGKYSEQMDSYANDLLADILAGGLASGRWTGNFHTERGKEFEPEARAFYKSLNDIEIEEAGFCLTDCKTYGCSPDGFVGDDGLIEIKCPEPKIQIERLLKNEVGKENKPQIQGQLLVTGRKWCDRISYHTDLPPLITRVERDEAYISLLKKALEEFNNLLELKKQRLRELGYL